MLGSLDLLRDAF